MERNIKTQKFIQKALLLHGNKYDYSKVKYTHSHSKVIIKCSNHGDFYQSPNSHLQGAGCCKCKEDKNRISIEEFINKSKQIHNNKYDYSKVVYKNANKKITIICPVHGEFEQSPNHHLKGSGCTECYNINRTLSNEEFINKAKAIHGDKYKYHKVKYQHNTKKVCLICPKHGLFYQRPQNHLAGRGCPICKSSKGELEIKKILNKFNIKSVSQYRIPDEKYLLKYDFYLPELNILIEFHGIQHYKWIPYFQKTYYIFEQQKLRDVAKIDLAKMKGIKLLEFNYKQLKYLSDSEFENLIISAIKK